MNAEDLHIDQVRAHIAELVSKRRVRQTERVRLREALGRVLAEDVVSGIAVPAHDNSAMDGFAFRGSELVEHGPSRFKIAGTVLAGTTGARVEPGEAIRIMTGAPMPAALDTVVPRELVLTDGITLDVPQGVVRLGDNRRCAGEDIARGACALSAG